MDEVLIVRYLNGELSTEEKSLLTDRVNHDEEFRRLFIETKNIWTLNQAVSAGSDETTGSRYRDFVARYSKKKGHFVKSALYYSRNVAAVLFLPLLVVSAILFFTRDGGLQVAGQPILHAVFTPMGVKSCTELPDGTKVWLNSGSKLTYPAVFSEGKRMVVLEGEAYFEVKHDKTRPFRVTLPGGGDIEVLGTVFDVSCYANDPFVTTVLVEGEVVLHQSGKSVRMSPLEGVVYAKAANSLERKKVDTDQYVSWKDGKLIFRNTPMDDVIRKLERWYGVDIQITGPEVLDNRITATFSGENLTQVLDLLRLSSPINYKVDNSVVFLSAR